MEQVLGVLLHFRCVAIPPGGMDGIAVDDATVREISTRVEAGLLPHLAQGRMQGRLARLQAAGDGLPEIRRLAAQQLQYLAVIRVDDHQYRFGSLKSCCARDRKSVV